MRMALMAELLRGVRAGLDEAASCLLAVGYADPFGTEPGVRLHCLWAVEHLRTMGAHPERVLEPLLAEEVDGKIRVALRFLTSLPPDVAASRSVIEAIATARAALESLG